MLNAVASGLPSLDYCLYIKNTGPKSNNKSLFIEFVFVYHPPPPPIIHYQNIKHLTLKLNSEVHHAYRKTNGLKMVVGSTMTFLYAIYALQATEPPCCRLLTASCLDVLHGQLSGAAPPGACSAHAQSAAEALCSPPVAGWHAWH